MSMRFSPGALDQADRVLTIGRAPPHAPDAIRNLLDERPALLPL